jgi:hypothetical protein
MDAALSSLAPLTAKQHALITRTQLLEAKLTRHEVQGLLDRRVLERVRRGVYVIVGAPDSWERGLHAAVLAAGEDAVASHSAAARLWNFVPAPELGYEVTVPTGGRPARLRGVAVHRTTRRDDADVARRVDIPCTSFERTLCDCTTRLSEFQLGKVLDDGLRRQVATLRRLKDCAERLESGPGRHMSMVRALLAERDPNYDPGGSDDELRVLKVLKRAGLPLPAQQEEIEIQGKPYRPDYVWRMWKIFSEYYGRTSHIGASAVAYDNERITALATAGWLPLIFTWQTSDQKIIDETVAALRARGVWPLEPPEAA